MQTIYQIATEQRNFLYQKGYNNNNLNFNGMPDTTFTQIFNALAEGIIKTWPENIPFEFNINTAGKYEQLPGIAYLKFQYQFNPGRLNIYLAAMNITFHSKTIDIRLGSPKDLPPSSNIPDLINRPASIHRKHNGKSKAIPDDFNRGINR